MQGKIIPVSIVIFCKNITSEGLSLWMQVREEKGPLNGLLEFPGGKIEEGESSEDAARREVYEEVNFSIPANKKLPLFIMHPYTYSDRNIQLFVHVSNCEDVPESSGQWFDFCYVEKSKKYEGKIPSVNHLIIDKFIKYIKDQVEENTLGLVWN